MEEEQEEEYMPTMITSNELGKVSKDINEIKKNPILHAISNYLNGCQIYEKEDEREREELKIQLNEIKKLLDTGIYEDSTIAHAYKKLFDIYNRLLWIYTKNVSLANQEIVRIKKIVDKHYVSKDKYDEDIMKEFNKTQKYAEKMEKLKEKFEKKKPSKKEEIKELKERFK